MKRFSILLSIALTLGLAQCKEVSEKEGFEVVTMEAPVGPSSAFPYLFAGTDRMWMSWVETGDSLTSLKVATYKEGEWQEAQEVTAGADWFVNWADFPAITENNGHLLSHTLQKSSGGTYSYDVILSFKAMGQDTWENNLPLHTDSTFTEHGFVSSAPYGEGFFVSWLDGRNTEEKPDGSRGAMSIRAAEINSSGEVRHSTMLDERTCDCCQTTVAVTQNGPVVLYRDRSDVEVRDISIVRQVNGEWTEPQSISEDGWKINGCPVNGPKAAAKGNNLVVAWFTAAAESPAVKVAFSTDGGAQFEAPVRVAGAEAMGRVDVVLIDEETAIVSWMGEGAANAAIYAVQVKRNGEMGPIRFIAELGASRSTGFPQMELLGDRMYFAWTDAGKDESTVRCAYSEVDSF